LQGWLLCKTTGIPYIPDIQAKVLKHMFPLLFD
jgi:hypothetical protein